MRIALSLLTLELDRLGGLNIKLAALIRGLALRDHRVFVIQTAQAIRGSRYFYESLLELPVTPVAVDLTLKRASSFWLSLPLLWSTSMAGFVPPDIDVLDLWHPQVRIPGHRPYRIIFSHNHFSPYLWSHLRRCGPRSLPMFVELPFLWRMLAGSECLVDGYVTETEYQRSWLAEHYDVQPNRTVAIPPGYDAQLIRSLRSDPTPTPAGSPVIAYAGRLSRWKGVFELLDAFIMLSNEFPAWHLHFIGSGAALAALQDKVELNGLNKRVLFWGRQSHVETLRLLASASLFVLPSYIEILPLSLIEAMALGLPAVASDVGGIGEHLIQNEVSGLLVSPKDSRDLCAALRRLLSDRPLRQALGMNARRQVRDLTFDRMVQSTADFYARLLARPVQPLRTQLT